MGQKEEKCEANIISRQLKLYFHSVCLTLLSLLLPLSYLLLCRLSYTPLSPTFIILYVVVSFLSVSSLFYSITGHTLHIELPNCIAWVILCLFQTCITFGIEGTIRDGFQPIQNANAFAHEMWLKRTFLLIGIYEQMMLWKDKFVKPVVDSTFIEERMEQRNDRFLMGLSFSGLWLWLLQTEVEPLVLASTMVGFSRRVGWCDFIIWFVTFATLMTGFVRAVQFLVWQLSILLQLMYCRVEEQADGLAQGEDEV
ncbi:uncharacterized protein LOC110106537 [Dendrobium catenatum]|uniref:Uncharacterized protein n=1 Tax=Dendrobium catenatum TaxID=906689 RepID=A0A2I0X6R2_9ASPA|nr:uncharacterized protein LOC110106537 [Dendrobium catenatum]PKU83586.1 hypothetical protein MA16_Dca008273 [Dendrobium catenatum]